MVHTNLHKLWGKSQVSIQVESYRRILSKKPQDSGGVGGTGAPTVSDHYPRGAKERIKLAR